MSLVMPNAKREGRDVTMHLQHPDGFNPNNSIYKTCCCHVKTFTIVMGIFEIFIICFLLVAVLPDVTTRVCDMMTNETEILNPFDNFHIENVRNGSYVSSVLCHNNIACLVWAALQIFAVNVMFYGIKTINHWYFVPHFVFRITTLALLALVEAWLIYITAGEIEDLTPYYTTIAAFVIVIVAMLYATVTPN
uniref:Uncharacterized protein n=1 Tax=Caenorhabditis japonica TaxID=281687 RepID=A0A8R1I2M5_CAEJA